MQCGQYYTVASTVNNELLLWGAKSKGNPGQRLSSANKSNENGVMKQSSVTEKES